MVLFVPVKRKYERRNSMKKRISAAVLVFFFCCCRYVWFWRMDCHGQDGLITEKFGEGALLLWIAVEPFYSVS